MSKNHQTTSKINKISARKESLSVNAEDPINHILQHTPISRTSMEAVDNFYNQ